MSLITTEQVEAAKAVIAQAQAEARDAKLAERRDADAARAEAKAQFQRVKAEGESAFSAAASEWLASGSTAALINAVNEARDACAEVDIYDQHHTIIGKAELFLEKRNPRTCVVALHGLAVAFGITEPRGLFDGDNVITTSSGSAGRYHPVLKVLDDALETNDDQSWTLAMNLLVEYLDCFDIRQGRLAYLRAAEPGLSNRVDIRSLELGWIEKVYGQSPTAAPTRHVRASVPAPESSSL